MCLSTKLILPLLLLGVARFNQHAADYHAALKKRRAERKALKKALAGKDSDFALLC